MSAYINYKINFLQPKSVHFKVFLIVKLHKMFHFPPYIVSLIIIIIIIFSYVQYAPYLMYNL